MPIYEYRCSKCGNVFEVRQKFSDTPLATHEDCGGTVERLVSASALQFKGSGWYVTDYARASSKQESKSEAKGESKSDSSKESKTESKSSESKPSESKSETKTDSKPAPASKSE